MAFLEAHLQDFDDIEIVGVANRGDEGLKQTLELKPQVLFLDLALPGMSGLEISKKVGLDLPETRVIAMSSLDSEFVNSELEQSGCYAFIKKPFTKNRLKEVLSFDS